MNIATNSCKKVKNPCKMCLETVKKRTGVQCQGPCKIWIHYKCLGYSPEEIQDLKAGIKKVTCPCPICNDLEPNLPMKCENTANPRTRYSPQTVIHPCEPTSGIKHVIEPKPLTDCKQPPKCTNPDINFRYPGHNTGKFAGIGKACKPIKHVSQGTQNSCYSPINKPQPKMTNENCINKHLNTDTQDCDKNVTFTSNKDNINCNIQVPTKRSIGCNVGSGIKITMSNKDQRNAVIGEDKCYKADKVDESDSCNKKNIEICKECCCNKCMCSLGRAQSCLCLVKSDCLQEKQSKEGNNIKACKCASESALSSPTNSRKYLMLTIHQLCYNMGNLSKQIKKLMCHMTVETA
ncbi:hypothetical protein ACJJTC_014172 [Scirpophaga incertulas]